MHNRYSDIGKFITDSSQLKLEGNSEVYISSEENYDIVVDLDEQSSKFEELKPFIVFIAKHVCELDNIAQRYIRLNHPGSQFPYNLAIIYIDSHDTIRFDYWGTIENTQFSVVFKDEGNEFKLKGFGLRDDIPDNWDEDIV